MYFLPWPHQFVCNDNLIMCFRPLNVIITLVKHLNLICYVISVPNKNYIYLWEQYRAVSQSRITCHYTAHIEHDDVIKWKHFPRYWPFVRGIHWSPVNSPHKGQWRYHAHYDVIVMRLGENNCHFTDNIFKGISTPIYLRFCSRVQLKISHHGSR